MKVRYTPAAAQRLRAILDYITAQNPQGAQRVLASVKAAETTIEQFPLIGTQSPIKAIRRIKISSYPYFIFYQVTDSEIIIHTVRHTARRPLI